jgi:hypothetical protein
LDGAAFAADRAAVLDQAELEILAGAFEGIACAGLARLPLESSAFPILMALACSGHRGWAYPRDAFVVAVVSHLERKTVDVGLPFFDPKSVEYPDDAPPPPQPVGHDAESRMADVQRIDLFEVLPMSAVPGRYRVWLLHYDWCSNPWDVEVFASSSTPGLGSAAPMVAPPPASGAVSFIVPAGVPMPSAPGMTLEVRPRPGGMSLFAVANVEAQTAHLLAQPRSIIEADGQEYPVAAVVPCTLILTSHRGGPPQVFPMGAAALGARPQPGHSICFALELELTHVFGIGIGEHLLWAWLEGSLYGPVVVG